MPIIYTSKADDLPDRIPKDHYPTEFALVEAAIAQYGKRNAASILDLGAGNDARWGAAAWRHNRACRRLAAVELRALPQPDLVDEWYNIDFTLPLLAMGQAAALYEPPYFDLIVSNPPFKFAETFIRQAWQLLNPQGRMIFLTQADFAASGGRYNGLWVDLPPSLKVTVVRRIVFTGKPNDPNTHCLWIFDKDSDGNPMGKPRQWSERLLWHDHAWELQGLSYDAYVERYGVDFV
jgi:SAM-dependent methyltransferase